MDFSVSLSQHAADISSLRKSLSDTLVGLRQDMEFSRRELHHLGELLVDDALLYRFLRKHKFNIQAASQAFLDHVDWRLQNDLPNYSTASLTPKASQLCHEGLFYFWKTDVYGRPLAILNLKRLDAKGTDLEDLRSLFIMQMEVARRIVHFNNDQAQRLGGEDADRLNYQVSVVVDLDGVGLGNINYEMIPLFHDLFSRHFPQTLGTVYVLNYGWFHSGMWSLLKTALPADACKKLQFLSKSELHKHVDPSDLQQPFGGSDPTPFTYDTSPIYTQFAHPNYHVASRRVLEQLSALDAEDEGYHEDEDVWFDAIEQPMTPVRSAADLQSMLRVASGRNLHGMVRVGSSARIGNGASSKSLKSLARPGAPNLPPAGGLMMRALQTPPVTTTVIANPFTAAVAAAAASLHSPASKQPGRRRAIVKKTLVKAVQTPAQPFISFLSFLIPGGASKAPTDITTSPTTSSSSVQQAGRKRSKFVLTLLFLFLLYGGWKSKSMRRLYIGWILGSSSSALCYNPSLTSAAAAAAAAGVGAGGGDTAELSVGRMFGKVLGKRDVGVVVEPAFVTAIGGALGT
ncbi:uncharacterized protein EV422DRAFT_2611 [Fimicolochytrium jonesii]|uniref:uncharacterized protein n=1 Tax=Fimicolochytrium jonesii TaxID=1396493 RepID=UPI0022FE4FBA|nr:uncharacterized protein EV422DRAFT_2611 [Fimicolochytrium jonesii]KAI8826590.1 hypothetical protein EV422DRAFT_2611 [Fimicolochytrium jonesii]